MKCFVIRQRGCWINNIFIVVVFTDKKYLFFKSSSLKRSKIFLGTFISGPNKNVTSLLVFPLVLRFTSLRFGPVY